MSYSPMELANAFIRAGELPDALQALDTQLTAQPDDDEARRLRAAVLLRLPDEEHLQRARTDLEALAAKTPADYVQLSILAERLADPEQAVAMMQSACQLAPDDERLLERLLSLLIKQQHFTEALTLVRSRGRDWRWLQWEADLLTLCADFTAAAAVYQQALNLLEERLDYRANRVAGALRTHLLLALGYACRRSGQLETADTCYRAALEYYPDDTTIAFNRGLLLALRGELDEAVQQCRAALEATENPELRTGMIHTLHSETALKMLAERLLDSR